MRAVVWRGAAALLASSFAACASLDPRPTVDALRVDLRQRSSLELVWPADPESDAALLAATRELLADGLTADDAAQIAWQSSPELRVELEELGIAHARFVQASRLRNPSIELSRLAVRGGPGAVTEAGIAFDLLDFLIRPLRAKLGRMELEAARLRLGQHLLHVAADTRVAFYRLAAQERQAERMTTLRDLDAAAAELALRQYEAGTLSLLELERQRAAWNETRLRLAEVRLEARVAREALLRLLGLWGPDTTWQVVADVDQLPADERALPGLEQRALEQRLDMRAARAGVDLVAEALAVRQGTRFLPAGVEVGVASEKEVDGLRLIGPTLALELPIFDTGKAGIVELEGELRKARRQLEALAIDVRSQVREAQDRLQAAHDLLFFYRRTLIPQQATLFDQDLRHVNMMLHGVYDLVATRKQQLAVESEAIDRWRDYWIARVELGRALGGELPPPVATPEPGENE